MSKYKYNDGSKTDIWVKKMIPVLIHWAQCSWDKIHYYSDLARTVGFSSNQIGHFLGCIDDVIKSLDANIPTLNALVVNKKDLLPSYGFEYVYPDYDTYNPKHKQALVVQANKDAHDYDWTWVLDKLKLKPFKVLNEEEVEKLRNQIAQQYCHSGESEAHKKLKQYIAKHPERLDISNLQKTEMEFSLLSGDRLDVFFETLNEKIAVEVKSYISDEADITRGIFQCVKYKAVLEAENVFDNRNKESYSILVIEGHLSELQKQLVQDLDIEVFEDFVL